ncbi:MAG: glycosyltransferase [Halarsenatibacteraceae bacterium]
MKNRGKNWLLILVIIIVILVSYRIYAPYSIQDFNAVNIKAVEEIRDNIDEDEYSFSVVGNIKNSIAIFDNQILPDLDPEETDFILSTGNNLVNGDEAKYRVFHRTLRQMQIPFLSAAGVNEIEDEGHQNFYKYFGPFYYSFEFGNSYFIFIDNTGNTNMDWQNDWLERELRQSQDYQHSFVVMNLPPVAVDPDYLIDDEIKYLESESLREYYQDIFSSYGVDAVFASNLEVYNRTNISGVEYFISGGAGGDLVIDNENSFYHYLEVEVSSEGINYNLKRLKNSPGAVSKFFENIWVVLQSFIYTNYLNIMIILLIVLAVFNIVYREINKEIDYYRGFAYSDQEFADKKLKIAMFTNNYFPVIGGVPISIKRLSKALKAQGHEVRIFAPEYDKTSVVNVDEDDIIRCNSLYYYKKHGLEFSVTNIFSPQIRKKFESEDFDVVHCHHPFWLGGKGKRLAEKNDIPLVFTYHTRLEKYAHYVPNILFARKFFANRLSHFLIRNFANKADAVFAPTESTKNYLRNVGVSRYIKIMPTGVDLKEYDCPNDEVEKIREEYGDGHEHLLITVSRLSKEKNLYFLLDGIRYLRDNSSLDFKLIIVGGGPEKENIQDYIKEHDLQDNIELIGTVDFREISKYYLASDLFVFASTTETQGMVILEAMAGYTPVVAVRSSGIDDVINNDDNGYKTEEKVEAWANKIEKILSDKSLQKKLTENARQMAEEYSIANMARDAEDVYQKIIQLNSDSNK